MEEPESLLVVSLEEEVPLVKRIKQESSKELYPNITHEADTKDSNKSESNTAGICEPDMNIKIEDADLSPHVEYIKTELLEDDDDTIQIPTSSGQYCMEELEDNKEHLQQFINKDVWEPQNEKFQNNCFKCPNETEKTDTSPKAETSTIDANEVEEYQEIKCEKCNFVATSVLSLKLHVEGEHTTKKYVCKFCTYATICARYLKNHLKRIHKEKIVFECSECDFTSDNEIFLRNHISILHVHITPNNSDLTEHKTAHVPPKPFRCKECNFSTTVKGPLVKHISSKHQKIKKCKFCDFRTKDNASLEKHRATFHSDIQHKCRRCPYTSNTQKLLNYHMRKVHFGDHKCPKCDFSARFKVAVIEHFQTIHPGESYSEMNISG